MTTARNLETATAAADACPRCNSLTLRRYDETTCPACGWVKYETEERVSEATPVTRITERVIRYKGEFAAMRDTRVRVRIARRKTKLVSYPFCPFCGAEMRESSLSGKRRDIREERYACPLGHRISLVPTRNGGQIWR